MKSYGHLGIFKLFGKEAIRELHVLTGKLGDYRACRKLPTSTASGKSLMHIGMSRKKNLRPRVGAWIETAIKIPRENDWFFENN
ncbi:MAG: hypothetical protein ABFD59_12845 [Smithella sp.]|jgi:hypothetical protein